MTARASVAGMAIGAMIYALAAGPTTAQSVVSNLVVSAEPQPFTADDLLWMEVRADEHQLAESMNVYASRSGVFLPLGEFSRILDFAVGVFPAQQRAEGWVISPDRHLVLDLAGRTATRDGRVIAFASNQAAIYEDDLYVRADLIERLLPVKIKADVSAQLLIVTPTETLPFQRRLALDSRRAGLRAGAGAETAVRVETPYQAFSPPSFDVNIGGQVTRDGTDQARSFDLRAAGDLAYAGFQAFVGSDVEARIDNVRLLLERKDSGGRALGPLGATRAGIGDVFTPAMAIGAASLGGRGAFYTSAPLESLDLATPLDLRGELAIGEEVELYVNEVLRASQATPIQGRYQFLDVPLTFGLNTIRLVFYGSQGQTREDVRRINFGTGQVEAGRLIVRLGAVQQGRAVIDVGEPVSPFETGAARVVAMVDYGVSPKLTLSGGVARFTPYERPARTVGTLGLRGSIGGVAGQGDLAFDDRQGRGVVVGVAARPLGVSMVASHAEFSGGFIDETRQVGVGQGVALRRSSEFRADAQIARGALNVPISLDFKRNERTDSTWIMTSELRTSAPIDRFYLSGSLVYEGEKGLTFRRDRTLGAVDLATLFASNIQVRGGVTYEISPDARIDTAYATADFQLSEANALRLAIVRTLGPQQETSLQASNLYRARRFDIALNSAYETESGEWRAGVQLGFAFAPTANGYRFSRPGVSSGGSVSVDAYLDANGDGVRQPSEAPIPAVILETPAGAAVTGADGRAGMTGLGDGASARVRVNTEGVDDPFLVGGPAVIEFTPRPGKNVRINYPMQQSAEVELVARVRRGEGESRPLSALNVELVPASGGSALSARTDHAGVAFFEGVRPGLYSVRLDAAQAAPLGLRLIQAAQVAVPSKGGYVRGGDILIEVVRETMQ